MKSDYLISLVLEELDHDLRQFDPIIKQAQSHTGLKTYVVGGAVRDVLMGRKPKDIDMVVVGGLDRLKSIGYKPIKQDFPVFVHPDQPGVELALARGEKKTGSGHSDFDWYEAKDLATDLMRRDLTVNSMAYHPNDGLIDPHGGHEDIKAQRLRPVSGAFGEDALRTFRAARFASTLGFSIHPSLAAAMKNTHHDLPALKKDRVRDEFERALNSKRPSLFLRSIRETGSHKHWMPELDHLHPDTYDTLDRAAHGDASDHVRHLILASGLPHESIQSLGDRLGYGQRDTVRRQSHARWSAGHSSPDEAATHWRETRGFQPEHVQAYEYQKPGSGGYLSGLFDALSSVKINPKSMSVPEIRNAHANTASNYIKIKNG